MQHGLQLERGEPGVLAQDQGGDPGDARRGEAVARGADRAAAEPGDLHVDAACEELDGRIGVGVVEERVVVLVAADGDDRREAPRERFDRHVVRGGDQHGALEVGGVGQLVQVVAEFTLGRGEAHVDHVVALLDRPAQAGEQHLPGALEPGAEDAHRVELRRGSDRADDPRARRPVPAKVALGVLLGDRFALGAEGDHGCPGDLADERMVGLDAAVEDADLDARSRCTAERPLGVDALWQEIGDPDAGRRGARQ